MSQMQKKKKLECGHVNRVNYSHIVLQKLNMKNSIKASKVIRDVFMIFVIPFFGGVLIAYLIGLLIGNDDQVKEEVTNDYIEYSQETIERLKSGEQEVLKNPEKLPETGYEK